MGVGSHSRTHPTLRGLPPERLRNELVGSRDDLRALLGEDVRTLAYPYGLWDEAARRTAAETYVLAFSTHEGLNRAATDPAGLLRSTIYPTDGPLRFVSRVLFGRDLSRTALRRLQAQSTHVRRRVANSQRSPWRTMRSS